MLIITITGPSGAGKDTVAQMLSDETGIPVLVSYTTRPQRDDEVDGREHHFVKECQTDRSEMLAYTEYGNYKYWTEVSQVHSEVIYVIDEEGMLDMHCRHPHIDLLSIYVTATEAVRLSREVTQERIDRDLQRQSLPASYYDFRISNNKSIAALKHKVRDIANHIIYKNK